MMYILGGAVVGYFAVPMLVSGTDPLMGAVVGAVAGYAAEQWM